MLSVGGRIVSIRNEEVLSEHMFIVSELSEVIRKGCTLGGTDLFAQLSHLNGVADLSVGNSVAGAITLSGQAVSWKRDNSSGKMSSLPVQIAPSALSVSCGTETSVIVPSGVWLRNKTYLGRFSQVASGQFHTLLLSGQFIGSTTFGERRKRGRIFGFKYLSQKKKKKQTKKGSDAQSLLFSGEFSDVTIAGIPCHGVFLRASGIERLDVLDRAFKDAPEHLIKAFLLFVYCERLNLDEESSAKLLSLLEHAQLTQPKRLLQILRRSVVESSTLSSALLSVEEGKNVTLLCEDGVIETHMCLLAMRSKFFAAAGSDRWQV